MGSIAAQEVAKEILGNLGKQIKPNITQVAIRKGLSPKYANSGQVQKTKAYKKVIKPFVDSLVEERERAIKAMKGKISKAKYRDLTDAIDKLTKSHQLLTGGSTENVQVRPILDV